MRIAIVVSRFNDFVTERLLTGAQAALAEHGIGRHRRSCACRAPSRFRSPRSAWPRPGKVAAVVCLGCLIRGATPHFEFIASACAHGITAAAAATGVPMAFGVLTTNSVEEALERAAANDTNKGREAALAALEMARHLRRSRRRATMTAESGGSRWDGRRRARETALRVLYQSEIGGQALPDALRIHGLIGDADAIDTGGEAREYADRLATGVTQNQAALDAYISEAALNWRLERLAVIDRIVLRLGIHELLAEPGTPPRVVIDESIELARLYSGDEAARFVNGVLDAVFKTLKDQGKVIG